MKTMPSPNPANPTLPATVAAPQAEPSRIDSRRLLGSARCVEIIHAGERYRLQLTRQNKLILTK